MIYYNEVLMSRYVFILSNFEPLNCAMNRTTTEIETIRVVAVIIYLRAGDADKTFLSF